MGGLLVGTDSGLAGGGLDGHRVVDLTGDGWAVTDARAVWQRVDGTWHQVVDAGPTGLDVRCLAHTPSGVLLGTSEAHLLRYDGGADVERVTAFDEADDRAAWYTPWGGPADVRSIAVAPDLSVFVNVHVGGVVRSTDGGGTWRQTLDIDVDVHQIVVHGSGTVLAACGDGGLAVSRDGGESWRFDTAGLDGGTYCRAVAVAGETVLLSASTGPFTHEGAVYRRPLAGDGPFERCTDVFPFNIDTFQLAGSPVGDGRAAFGTDAGEVWESADEGRSWERTSTGLAPVRAVAFS
jgi:hypothetical protein